MEYTLLGRSNLKVSRVGFGCMSLPADLKQSESLILGAIDYGINFFDTADLYERGENEARIGKIIRNHRNNIILATKVGNQWRNEGEGWDWNPSKDYILKAVDESLRRLQTDHIDLYQLHGGTISDPIDEAIEAFELLKQQGKISYYGISSIRPNVIREYVNRSAIVSVMLQYSLLDRRPEESALNLLQENEIGVLARGSLAQGLLVGKQSKQYLDHPAEEVKKAADAVRTVSGTKRSSAQTALLYNLQRPMVSVAVAGIRTENQLHDAGRVFDVSKLSDFEITTLEKSIKANCYNQHR